MPEAPVLASHARGGCIVPTRLALCVGAEEDAAPWGPRHQLDGLLVEVDAAPRGEWAELRLVLRNEAARPRRCEAVRLGFAWQAPEGGPAATRSLGAAALASRGPGEACALVGVRSAGRSLARAAARTAPRGAELEVQLEVGAELRPGELRALETVELACGTEANALLEALAERWGREAGARGWRPAPLVWLAEPEEAAGAIDLGRAADALGGRRELAPFETLLVGPDVADDAAVRAAERIRNAGLVPGLRIAPLGVGVSGALDPTREGVLDAIETRLRRFHEAGFFVFALEGLGADLDAVPSDPGCGPAARLHEVLEAVRRGASDEAFLLALDGPPDAGVGVVDARRLARGAEALRWVWMHRRLWVCACDSVEAALAGAMLVVTGDPAAAGEKALVRGARLAKRALEVDQGPPGAVRVGDPLAPEPRAVAARPPAAPPALAVFCDFDGTFSVQDVGATLAVRHGGERRAREWARYERGEITPWDYNLAILDGLPVGTEALEAFLDEVDLDPGAEELVAWCRERRVPFRILSDGFDWNLNRLQALRGVRFAYTANRLRVEHGRWRIEAGAPDPECGCGTGTCKGSWLRAFRRRFPQAHRVHIGNGRVSDSCGALEADTAFAKDSLAEALARRGEPFVRFETLRDVIPRLEQLLETAPVSRAALGEAPATR